MSVNKPNLLPAFLRPAEAASYCGVDRRTLCQWVRRGIIPAARMGRKCTLYARRDLEAAIEARMSGTIHGRD